mgnify:CR=1 FL=1
MGNEKKRINWVMNWVVNWNEFGEDLGDEQYKNKLDHELGDKNWNQS